MHTIYNIYAELPDNEEDYNDYEIDYDYDFDEEDYCLDHDLLIFHCQGRDCIRDPYSNETCMQCIEGCNGQYIKKIHGSFIL